MTSATPPHIAALARLLRIESPPAPPIARNNNQECSSEQGLDWAVVRRGCRTDALVPPSKRTASLHHVAVSTIPFMNFSIGPERVPDTGLGPEPLAGNGHPWWHTCREWNDLLLLERVFWMPHSSRSQSSGIRGKAIATGTPVDRQTGFSPLFKPPAAVLRKARQAPHSFAGTAPAGRPGSSSRDRQYGGTLTLCNAGRTASTPEPRDRPASRAGT